MNDDAKRLAALLKTVPDLADLGPRGSWADALAELLTKHGVRVGADAPSEAEIATAVHRLTDEALLELANEGELYTRNVSPASAQDWRTALILVLTHGRLPPSWRVYFVDDWEEDKKENEDE